MKRTPSLPERLGNIFAFGLVLAVLIAGGYAIYRIIQPEQSLFSFGGSEEVRPTLVVALARQPTLTPFEGMRLEPTRDVTATLGAEATALVTESATAEPTPSATSSPTPTASATATATATETATATATPFPTVTPLPTVVPPTATPDYLFYASAAGPDYGRGCAEAAIFGYVRDAVGNPLPNLRVWAYNQTYVTTPATTQREPGGWYQIAIPHEASRWYVQVLDAASNLVSPPVEVIHTGNFVSGSEACWHQVDFTRKN